MPSRPTSRPAAGPGRGTVRTSSRPEGRAAAPTASVARDAASIARALRRRSSLTTRAIALGVVLMVLVISYATSLRIYVAQRSHITATQQQIVEQQTTIAALQGELNQWNDPNFVKAQARQRLGWVIPGETGYKVIGPDGKPLDGGVELDTRGSTVPEVKPAWWAKLWGSVRAADDPAPAPTATKAPTIGPDGTR